MIGDYDYYLILYSGESGVLSPRPMTFDKGVSPIHYCDEVLKQEKDNMGKNIPKILSYEIYVLCVGNKVK